jgi:hypothetical protein
MSEQRSFIDYRQGGDTGNDNVDSIQPISDGEAASQNTFRRPSENIRGRTEAIRDGFRELLYYRDFGVLKVSHPSGSSIAWGGSTTTAGTGIITQTGAITIRPMLSPSASKKGTLNIGVAGNNRVTYTVSASGYATEGLDQVTVEHRDGGAGAALTVSIAAGPVKRILVIFDSANAAHNSAAVVGALTPAIAGDAVLAGNLTVTDNGLPGNIVAAAAEARIEGTVDQQAHVLATGLLTTYTTGNPLAEGDCVAIWYRYLVEFPETGVPGGRWESNPDRATSNIPIGSLFVTNDSPEKIPGAIPICKVIENELVFVDGSRFAAGSTGALGSVDAGSVTLDPIVFTGNDTAAINGGIDNALSPETVLEALQDVDLKIRNRRAFTYVCTDNATSFGGNFSSTTALQDAITAMGGTGGTIFVRRGTYTLPDTYAVPVGVHIVGEGSGSVTINQAVPTSLSFTGNIVKNVAINVGTLQISVASDAHFSDSIIVGRMTVGSGCHFENFAITQTGASVTVTVTGNSNVFINCTVGNGVSVSGGRNLFDNVSYSLNATPAGHLITVSGDYNRFEGVDVSISTALSAGFALMSIGGNFNGVSGGRLEHSALTTGRYGLQVTGNDVTLNNLFVSAAAGSALYLQGSSVSLAATGCTFKNSSTTDNTVLDALLTQPHRLQFSNCVFDQTEQTAHPLWDMFSAILGDNIEDIATFTNCNFLAARLSDLAFRARYSRFYNCQFVIKNPVSGGVPRLGGVGDGQTTELFHFTNAVLRDCLVNGYDAEVNNSGGNPDIQAPLYVRLEETKAYNLSLVNLNRQVRANTVGYGLVNLRVGSVLEGLAVTFTATASVQGGGQVLPSVVNLSGSNVKFAGFRSDLTNWPGSVKPAVVHQLATAERFNMYDIHVSNDYTSFFKQEAAITMTHGHFDNIVMGVFGSGLGCSVITGVEFPRGFFNKFSNSHFVLKNTGGTTAFMSLFDQQQDLNFENLMFEAVGAVDNTRPVILGNGNTVTRARFTGCGWIATASGAVTKAFGATITFSACHGAGNNWTYSGGTAGAPSFSASINSW